MANKVDDLLIERSKNFARLDELRAEQARLNSELRPKIDSLKSEANVLAQQMRQKFANSQEAYGAGDGESAKILSNEGKAIRAKCEVLNHQVEELYEKINAAAQAISKCLAREAEIKSALKSANNRSKVMKGISITGFNNSELRETVTAFLEVMPTPVLADIEDVRFDSSKRIGDSLFLGEAMRLPDGRRSIVLYEPPEIEDVDPELVLAETLCHEVGHIIYENHAPTAEKVAWGTNFLVKRHYVSERASTSPAEDFCECFRLYVFDRDYLKDYDPRRFELVNSIWRSVKARP